VYLQKFNLAGICLPLVTGERRGIACAGASREAGSEYTSW
jgi:hypothetical protein